MTSCCRSRTSFCGWKAVRQRRGRPRTKNSWRSRMERSIEVLVIILFGVMGLSHILQPKVWAEFFILMRGKGQVGAFVDGFLNLPLGAVIVAFHRVWSGIPLVLTLV